MKILVAEDEIQMNRVLTTALTHEGYDVDSVYDGQAAIDMANENAYDVMVMDIMMPVKSGIEAVQEIRQTGNQSHIIMLTAMAEVDDRVTGLDAGADDYLTKPFSLKELLARLRSMSRRVDTNFTSNILTVGTVTLNVGEQELVSQNTIRLAVKESKMLEFFMLNVGKKLSTDQIFNHVWANDKDDPEIDNGYVFIYVSYLRQKLKSIGANVVIEGEEMGDYELKKL
ncbi:response regulator transcription factor [Streptococcus macedonicus]|uniref:Transcriptional regulatory protein DltR n=2 Tax=Streptococcus TaxID=1301 RepID=A0A081JH56_STRMC|nr:response regulator transcription factor [Streptococcus macedonicus]CCF02504.1 Two-component response regulator [Streptococcus macedonicus ACA-DC 198]SUN61535.1 two-component system response regulator [Streptococcus gallolyticus]KEH52169.1 transcriptional regulator [Streptococcus macedonicus]MBT1048024.1 response regulator transcription factor [Streptococcus macedonicus]MCW8485285.1 response regulator transcription factor [Streptococcus macedonicus]